MPRVLKRICMVAGALVLAAIVVFVLGGALIRAIPYQPFIIQSYVIRPVVVCPGAKVTATVTRRFTSQVDSFTITEAWVSVPGDRPVSSNTGKLPPSILSPQEGYKSAASPLLSTAPHEPGVYRVEITTRSEGTRFGIPVSGTATFYSSNTVRVTRTLEGKPCSDATG